MTCHGNFLYFGAVITDEQYSKLIDQIEPDVKTYIRKCGDKYIVHIPSTFYDFKNFNSLFESHELEQQFVTASELRSCLRDLHTDLEDISLTETEINDIMNPSDKLKEQLNKIIKSLNDDTLTAKLRMGQLDYSNMVVGHISTMYCTYNNDTSMYEYASTYGFSLDVI